MNGLRRLRLILADDHRMVAEGLRLVLEELGARDPALNWPQLFRMGVNSWLLPKDLIPTSS